MAETIDDQFLDTYHTYDIPFSHDTSHTSHAYDTSYTLFSRRPGAEPAF